MRKRDVASRSIEKIHAGLTKMVEMEIADRVVRKIGVMLGEQVDDGGAAEVIDYGPFTDGTEKVYTRDVERFLNRKLKGGDLSRVRLGLNELGYFLVLSETSEQRICLYMARSAIIFERKVADGWEKELCFQRTPRGPYVRVNEVE